MGVAVMKQNTVLKISLYLKFHLPVVITVSSGGHNFEYQLDKALQITLHPVWFPDDDLFIVI